MRRELRDRAARLAKQQHVSMAAVLDRALAHLEREAFFAQAQAELGRLRDADPQGWESYLAESREWERATVGDGLGREAPTA